MVVRHCYFERAPANSDTAWSWERMKTATAFTFPAIPSVAIKISFKDLLLREVATYEHTLRYVRWSKDVAHIDVVYLLVINSLHSSQPSSVNDSVPQWVLNDTVWESVYHLATCVFAFLWPLNVRHSSPGFASFWWAWYDMYCPRRHQLRIYEIQIWQNKRQRLGTADG